jgi:hypothetical protein
MASDAVRGSKREPNTIELVWMVPATEKGIQEIAGNEKMHLISPDNQICKTDYGLGGRAGASRGDSWDKH